MKQLAFYTPLIDLTPSDPNTMMTPMVEAGKTTHSTSQKDTVFTCDQQLYKVLTDKNWAYPERFQYLIPWLGTIHLLMSFIGRKYWGTNGQ